MICKKTTFISTIGKLSVLPIYRYVPILSRYYRLSAKSFADISAIGKLPIVTISPTLICIMRSMIAFRASIIYSLIYPVHVAVKSPGEARPQLCQSCSGSSKEAFLFKANIGWFDTKHTVRIISLNTVSNCASVKSLDTSFPSIISIYREQVR